MTELILSRERQQLLRGKLGQENTLTETLAGTADFLAEGQGWVAALTEAAPFLKDLGDAADEFKIVAAARKLAHRWAGNTDPYDLGALALTLGYQRAVTLALGQLSGGLSYQKGKQAMRAAASRMRAMEPAEAAALDTFEFETALHHPFVLRAHAILRALLAAAELSDRQQADIMFATQRNFLSQLRLLLNDERTAKQFEPFKSICDNGADRQRADWALLQHANYQVAQYAARPLLNREPFALQHIYAETECVKRAWSELRDERKGFYSLNPADRRDLLTTVNELLFDPKFNDLIVVQGVAGAGKSSFTLRLCADLRARGYLPLRIRMKRLQLDDDLYAALSRALELEDEDRLDDLHLHLPDKAALLNRALLRTPSTVDAGFAQTVLIFDGWDELELTTSPVLREQVSRVIQSIRRELLDPQDRPRLRVIITGRPMLEGEKRPEFLATTPVLIIQPLTPAQLRAFAARLAHARAARLVETTASDEWRMPPLEVLEQVFQRYEQAYAKTSDVTEFSLDQDEAFYSDDYAPIENTALLEPTNEEIEGKTEEGELEESQLKEIDDFMDADQTNSRLPDELEVLGLPLLTFLAMRVMAKAADDERDAEKRQGALLSLLDEPTTLYRRLTDLVCPAAANPQQVGGTARPDDTGGRLHGTGLRRMLQETAAAISVQGNREYITRKEWEKRVTGVEESDLPAADSLSRLIVSFYFKGGLAEQSAEQSLEFMHKSFREYLFAEGIIEALKEFGRAATSGAIVRDAWRDFDQHRQPHHHELSRRLARLLAPQWLKYEVIDHLESLFRWEVMRADTDASAITTQWNGEPTAPLSLAQWGTVRDGMAALWAWWADGAHLRPQMEQVRSKWEDVPAFVHELITQWARPLAEELDATTPLASTTTLDAHLGDGLFRLTSLAHSLLIKSADSSAGRVLGGITWPLILITAEQGEAIIQERAKLAPAVPVTATSAVNPFQTIVRQGENKWIVFAPSGEPLSDNQLLARQQIYQLIARVNAEPGRPQNAFPANQTINYADLRLARLDGARLDGASLDGASLNRARLVGASLDGASLDGASLDGASLNRARLNRARLDHARLDGASLDGASLHHASLDGAILTRTRLDGASLDRASLDRARIDGADLAGALGLKEKQLLTFASLDEATQLPAEFAELKTRLLERQREREAASLSLDETGEPDKRFEAEDEPQGNDAP